MRTTEESIAYSNKIYDIIKKGGKLWAIKRTDTNQFLYHSLEMRSTDRPFHKSSAWADDVGFLGVLFLSKEDAEEEIVWLDLTEGGCPCCGNGAKKLPTIIVEHKFSGEESV